MIQAKVYIMYTKGRNGAVGGVGHLFLPMPTYILINDASHLLWFHGTRWPEHHLSNSVRVDNNWELRWWKTTATISAVDNILLKRPENWWSNTFFSKICSRLNRTQISHLNKKINLLLNILNYILYIIYLNKYQNNPV